MAAHAEDALTGARITQVLNLPLAVSTLEACRTESLIAGKNGKILNLVAAGAAAVRAVVADKGPIAQEKEVGVRVEQGTA